MIIVELINHKYQNEILDIIRLFFAKETIKFIDKKYTIDKNTPYILIKSEINELEDKIEFISKYICLDGTEIDNSEIMPICLDNKEIKTALKKSMYKLLSKVTKRSLPWGVLTGIRPVKIVHQLLEMGLDEEEVIKSLRNKCYVSNERASLALRIGINDRRFIKNISKNSVSIYIGIPFCPSRCYYCSFTSNSIEKSRNLIRPYINAIKKEIKIVALYLKNKGINVQTIYIGGGTPTSISADELEELILFINEFCPERKEFTCEAGRPDSITKEKLFKMKKAGIDRISINPQTMNDDTLQRIGRNHTSSQIIESFNLARSLGFNNINMDMIIGLPGENMNHITNTVKEIIRLKPENVTVHTMTIKRASIYKETPNIIDNNESIDKTMDYTRNAFETINMQPYYLYRQKFMVQNLENIGYCKKNFECIYNIQIMEEKQSIIAFGADAVTKVIFPDENRIERQHNIKDLKLYIERIDEQIEKKLKLLKQLYS